ncbi:MAG TPA: hypothetical protein VK404_12350 [Spirosoma sp.]|jgi:hypothetical protein|nr:hypothetical protein [Spirosoma sp.]
MVFSLSTINQQGETREFSLSGELEVGCRLFDHIARRGDVLLKATVLDGNRFSELPLESFYGSASLPVMEALEREWENILNRPVTSQFGSKQRLPDLIDRRVERHKACICHLEQAVSLAEQRLQRVFDTISREPHRTRMLTQLESVLKRHQQTLATERASLFTFLDQTVS